MTATLLPFIPRDAAQMDVNAAWAAVQAHGDKLQADPALAEDSAWLAEYGRVHAIYEVAFAAMDGKQGDSAA